MSVGKGLVAEPETGCPAHQSIRKTTEQCYSGLPTPPSSQFDQFRECREVVVDVVLKPPFSLSPQDCLIVKTGKLHARLVNHIRVKGGEGRGEAEEGSSREEVGGPNTPE